MRIDRAAEPTIPVHDDGAVRLDLADDSAVADPKLRIRRRDELDHAADPHTRSDAGSKKTSTDCIHDLVLRVTRLAVLPRTVESAYPFGEETVGPCRTGDHAGGSFELDG